MIKQTVESIKSVEGLGLGFMTYEEFYRLIPEKGPDECWPFLGTIHATGYGSVWFAGKHWMASRLRFYLDNPNTDTRLHILHSCDNPICCNPNHLRAGTQKENVQDTWSRGRGQIPNNKGILCGTSKLTEKDVLAIRAEAINKVPGLYKKLASEYGVIVPTIRKIVQRERWRHLS